MKNILFFLSLIISSLTFSQTTNSDTLKLCYGQKIYLQGETGTDGSLKVKQVDAIADSSKTIRIFYMFNSHTGSCLTISNPFQKTITYKAALYSDRKKKYINTNVYPVLSKLGARELWMGKADTVKVYGFGFKEDK